MKPISAKDLPAHVRRKLGLGSRSKYGAEPVIDPETRLRIASKREMKLLARLRAEAGTTGRIIALQPRFVIEGGVYTADAVEISIEDTVRTDSGFIGAMVRFWDAKGVLTPASKKSIRQVKARYGVDVRLE